MKCSVYKVVCCRDRPARVPAVFPPNSRLVPMFLTSQIQDGDRRRSLTVFLSSLSLSSLLQVAG